MSILIYDTGSGIISQRLLFGMLRVKVKYDINKRRVYFT